MHLPRLTRGTILLIVEKRGQAKGALVPHPCRRGDFVRRIFGGFLGAMGII